jgi:hypothetical protein
MHFALTFEYIGTARREPEFSLTSDGVTSDKEAPNMTMIWASIRIGLPGTIDNRMSGMTRATSAMSAACAASQKEIPQTDVCSHSRIDPAPRSRTLLPPG